MSTFDYLKEIYDYNRYMLKGSLNHMQWTKWKLGAEVVLALQAEAKITANNEGPLYLFNIEVEIDYDDVCNIGIVINDTYIKEYAWVISEV